MKVKLNYCFSIGGTEYSEGTVLDMPDAEAKVLVDGGTAIEYTAAMEAADVAAAEAEANAAAVTVAETIRVEMKTEATAKAIVVGPVKESKMQTFLKAIEADFREGNVFKKAAKDYAGTEATELLGVIARGADVFGLCTRSTVSGNQKIVFSSANGTSSNLPAVAGVAEATAQATTYTPVQYDAIPYKYMATVPIATEWFEDMVGLETGLTVDLQANMNVELDKGVLSGAFTNSYGLKGICGDTNALESTFASLTAPTKAELVAMVNKLDPALLKNAKWVLSPTFWAGAQAQLMDADNLFQQLISIGANPTLLGFPVVVSVAAAAAHPAVFADFSHYRIGVKREIGVQFDTSVGFNTDTTVAKISARVAGGLARGKSVFNGNTYAAAVYASVVSQG